VVTDNLNNTLENMMTISRDKQRENTINELHKKRTSPKTLEIQGAKTARRTATLFHDCTVNGTYDAGRSKMKRERLFETKPKRKARYEKSLVESIPPTYKMKKGKLKVVKKRKS
jgi:hypothetical protein|tara:strand:- start:4867 stop:5208 length:342 start_codon:yes stop_codon:yes gene_type:complete